mgnify:CR=1 FL=1
MREIDGYLETVMAQIRWKRARTVLSEELRDHLLSQREACAAEGLTEEAAEREAVRRMGDPITVGQELDRVHRPKPQWGLLALTAALCLAGASARMLLMAGNPDYVDGIRALVMKDAGAAILGIVLLVGGYLLDISFLGKHAGRICGVGMCLALVPALYIIRPEYSHWDRLLWSLTLTYPLIYGLGLYSLRGRGWGGFSLAVLAMLPFGLGCVFHSDASTLLMLAASGAALLFAAVSWGWFSLCRKQGIAVLTVLTCLGVLLALYWLSRYRRIEIAFHPERDPYAYGFMGTAIRRALRTALAWGPAGSWEDTGFLLRNTDLLPFQLVMRYGWLPALLLCGAVLGLLLGLLVKCLRQRGALVRVVSSSILLTLIWQYLWSGAMNLGLYLFEGSMPFLVGRLATAVNMFLAGILLSVFRCEALPAQERRRSPMSRA